MANFLSVLLCVVLSVVVSFVFAFIAWYTGVVSSFGLWFGLFWAGIYPLMFYVQATTVPAVKDGEPPRTAWFSHSTAMFIVIAFYLVMVCGWSAYLYARVYSMQPEVMSATEKLALRNRLAASIELTPTDTAILAVFMDDQTEEGKKIALEMIDKFNELESRRKHSTNRVAYREWLREKEGWRQYYLEIAEEIKSPTSASKSSSSAESTEGVYNPDAVLPWGFMGTYKRLSIWLKIPILVLLIAVGVQLVTSAMAGKDKDKRKGRLIKAVTIAGVALMLLVAGGQYEASYGDSPPPQTKSRPRRAVRVTDHAEAAPAASATPVRRLFTLNANSLGFKHRWVNTGIVLEPGQKIVLKIIGQPTLRNRGEDFCLPVGCVLKQFPGELWHGDARHMALLVAIGDSKPYATQGTATLDADALGRSGEIKLSVNQVVKKEVGGLDADFEWTQMTGEVLIEFTTV